MINDTFESMRNLIFLSFFVLISCSAIDSGTDKDTESDVLLDLVQKQTVNYFWDGAEPNSGLARERFHMDEPEVDAHVVTSGGGGFGLMALVVGIERGFIDRDDALSRFEQIADFLENADRFHGAWPHWMDGRTGDVVPFSPKDDGGDLVESAFLVQGMLVVREYLKDGSDREKAIAARFDKMWKEVEWNWYQNGKEILYWHWSPNYNWEINFGVQGYNECLIMYVLGASSPTYPIDSSVYHKGWAMDGSISNDQEFMGLRTVLNHYDNNDSPVGPLFWAHYSYLGLDPRNLEDRYGNYWELNRNHALIHYRHCVENPNGFEGYSENCWGLTSSYSPSFYYGHRPDDDIGVISPTAALSSFPYTPEESERFLQFLYQDVDSLIGEYGPYDAFSFEKDWYVPRYLAIDQGPIPVMIENYRSGLIWDLFMSAPEVKAGLDRLGFTYQ